MKKELGLAFKGNQKMVVEALEVKLESSYGSFKFGKLVVVLTYDFSLCVRQ